MQYGRFEVLTGPMFSGKSSELVRRIRLAEIAQLRVSIFFPALDTRPDQNIIMSRDGSKTPAIRVPASEDILYSPYTDIVAIDEAQFFDDVLPSVVNKLVRNNVRVIVSGLDLDFAGRPFGPMPALMAMADSVEKLNAVCMCCHSFDGRMSQRLIDGQPAGQDTPLLMIDRNDKFAPGMGVTTYQARCLSCYVSPEQA